MASATSQKSAENEPKQARSIARKRSLLEAAVALAAEHGAAGVTLRAVAKRARVPLAATTYYFDSRESLLTQAFERLAEIERREFEASLRALPERVSAGALARELGSAMAEDFRVRRSRVLAEYELHLEAGRRPALRPVHESWSMAAFEYLHEAMRRAGSLRPPLDAAVVLSVLSGLQVGQLADPDTRPDPETLFIPVLERTLGALLDPGQPRS